MKSANCISATGRIPIMAAPVQAPTIAVSASGASSTRHSPNSAWKPCVTLNAPPYTPTSSPMTNTRSSRRISSRRPSEMACRYVFTATPPRSSRSLVMRRVELLRARPHALERLVRLGQRARLGALDRLVQGALGLDRDLLVALVREVRDVLAEPGREAHDGVGREPCLVHLARHVE